MTAKEFATKYAGQQAKYTEEAALIRNRPANIVLGTIVGCDANYILIKPSDEYIRHYGDACWKPPVQCVTLAGFDGSAFSFSFRTIQLAKKQKAVKPYPNRCRFCNYPARKCDGFVFCSNSSCKSRKKVFATVGRTLTKLPTTKNNFVYCPECNAKAHHTYAAPNRVTVCQVGHKFNHAWIIGEMLTCNDRNYVYMGEDYVGESGYTVFKIVNEKDNC